jgi:hypothetical protein
MSPAHPQAHLEAIPAGSRAWAPALTGTPAASLMTHAAGDQIKSMIARIRAGLDYVRATAPQLPKPERWRALVRYIIDNIMAIRSKNPPPVGLLLPCLASESG